MTAAEIFSHDGLQQRLTRAGPAAGKRRQAKHDHIGRKLGGEHLVAADMRVEINIAGMIKTNHRLQENRCAYTRSRLEYHLTMGAMQVLFSVKTEHPSPAVHRKTPDALGGRQPELQEIIMDGQVDPLNAAADIPGFCLFEKLSDARMGSAVGGTVNQRRFLLLIGLPDIFYGEHGKQKTFLVVQGDQLTWPN